MRSDRHNILIFIRITGLSETSVKSVKTRVELPVLILKHNTDMCRPNILNITIAIARILLTPYRESCKIREHRLMRVRRVEQRLALTIDGVAIVETFYKLIIEGGVKINK